MATETNNVNENILINQIIDSGVNIYGSREKIRAELVRLAKQYLNISSDSDISKASYLAYLIDMISILSSNQIYYQSRLFNEFFLVTATLNESVQNLSKWIGYTIPKAQCSEVNVMFTLPLTFKRPYVQFDFPKLFTVRAGNLSFKLKCNIDSLVITEENENDTNIRPIEFYLNNYEIKKLTSGKIIDNSAITVRDNDGYYRPVYYSNETGNPQCSFTLQFEQCEYEVIKFIIPQNLQLHEFYNYTMNFDGQVSEMRVYMCSPKTGQIFDLNLETTTGEITPENFNLAKLEKAIRENNSLRGSKFTEWTECENGIYTMSKNSQQYAWIGDHNKGIISFGNGILGKQPPPGSLVVCLLKLTKGTEGNIINNTINSGDSLSMIIDNYSTLDVSYTCTNNNAAIGGVDILSTPEIKDKAIKNLKIRKRLVTDDDYDNCTEVVKNTAISECVPILKRSDIRINDITLYFLLKYYDTDNTLVPSRNVQLDFIEPQFDSDGVFKINKQFRKYVGKNKTPFVTVFNTKVNKNTRMASYEYVCNYCQGVATELVNRSIYSTVNKSIYISGTSTDFNVQFNTSDITNTQFPCSIKFNVSHRPNKVKKEYSDLNYKWKVKDFYRYDPGKDKDVQNFFEITHLKCYMITKWDNYDIYTDVSENYSEEKEYYELDDDYVQTLYKSFTFTIPNYEIIPQGKQRYEFQLLCYSPKTSTNGNILARRKSNGQIYEAIDKNGLPINNFESNDEIIMEWRTLKNYYSDVIIYQDMSPCMQSSVEVDHYLNGIPQYDIIAGEKVYKDVYHIYEVPTIYEKYYLEKMNAPNSDFETVVFQNLIENLNFESKRMMTDFTNVKFADTYGPMTNLRYNKEDYIVESRYSHTPWWNKQQSGSSTTVVPFPSDIAIENPEYVDVNSTIAGTIKPGVYYVINGKIEDLDSSIPVSEYMGYIANRIVTIPESGKPKYSYNIIKPDVGSIIKIKDELDTEGHMQTCYWSGHEWKAVEDYSIPMQISLKVYVDDKKVSISDEGMSEKIVQVLSDYYNTSGKMGLQKSIDKSEIIRVCRSIEGVQYVEVLSPEFDIKFNYEINDLKQEQLLKFTPQYIGFKTMTDKNKDYTNTTVSVNIVRN